MKFQEGDHVLYTGLCYGHTNIEGIVRVPIDGGREWISAQMLRAQRIL